VTASPAGPTPRTSVARVALALALGTAGGTVFAWSHLPLAWMLGAMSFTTVAALAGAPIAMPALLRTTMLSVLGVMLGSSFGPDLPGRLGQWAATIAGLFVYIGLVGSVGYLYLRRVAKAEPVTAYFTAMPGGLNEMTSLGAAAGGDDRVISLSHGVRLILVVFTIPFWFRYFEGYVPSSRPAMGIAIVDTPWDDWVVLALCAVAGPFLARMIRFPAPHLTGSMFLSAAVHIAGFRSKVPQELVMAAQVAIGAALGCRFTGLAIGKVFGTIVSALGLGTIMLAGTVLLSLVLSRFTGIGADVLLLGFSPGGFGEMSLVALALGLDTALVATHQLIRILLVIVLAPLFYRLLPARATAAAKLHRHAPGD
jgi:membrane AbrB-like protein